MIKPTIGRIVWFYPYGRSQVEAKEQPHAAIIAYVHSAECINIAYFDVNGIAKPANGVRLCHDDEPRPDFAFAEWMPYQIGQAAKTAELATQLG